jgi:hypothetical protein
LLPHRSRLAAAIAVILPFHAWAQADAVKVAPGDHQTDAAPVRQGALLDTFGKWEIRKGLIDNTYLLTGESTGDGEGRFWLHCDQNSMMTVAVPLAERTGQERLRSQAVTIRSDTGIKPLSLVRGLFVPRKQPRYFPRRNFKVE